MEAKASRFASRTLLSLGAMLVAGTQLLDAQTVVLDEGRYLVFRNGREVGSETFTIQMDGPGRDATLYAHGVVTINGPQGPMQMRPVLQAGTAREPVQYLNRLEGYDITGVEITSRPGEPFVSVIESPAGQREREVRWTQGAVFLDRDVAHHFYFLGARVERIGAVIPVVVPSTGEQFRLEVTAVDAITFELGRERLEARRVRMSAGESGIELILDPQGLVLQVEVARTGYRAVRQPS